MPSADAPSGQQIDPSRGVLPLRFPEGRSGSSLGLDGTETFDSSGITISDITALNDGGTPATVRVTAAKESGAEVEFDAEV
jgi:aconitate hydratase